MTTKRKFLTLDDRIQVIRMLESGLSSRVVAQKMEVGKTQILGIMKRKREIEDDFEQNSNTDRKRTKMACRITGNEDLNRLCFEWFRDATGRQVAISGPLIKEKALKFASDLGLQDFKA